MLRIGILDQDDKYVKKFTTYLNHQGKGKWNIVGFTNKDKVCIYLQKKYLEIMIITEKKEMEMIKEKYPEVVFILLSEDLNSIENNRIEKNSDYYMIDRFQSAKEIGKTLYQIIKKLGYVQNDLKQIVAIYSPIGRCGKTTLALEIVRDKMYGKWLYVGMEDYNSFEEQSENMIEGDIFFYYIKERKKQKILDLFEDNKEIVSSPFSFIDTKTIGKEDILFFKKILKETFFCGAIFDISSAALEEVEILNIFDIVMVPYIEDEKSKIKMEQFKKMLQEEKLKERINKMEYINMDISSKNSYKIRKLLQDTDVVL